MSDVIHDLLQINGRFLDWLRPWVEAASTFEWSESSGYLPIVRRSVVRRQFDSLEAIVSLVRENRSEAAVPILRPACEELFWIKYLNGPAARHANELLACMMVLGMIRDLDAQAGQVGASGMDSLGLADVHEGLGAKRDTLSRQLVEIGENLGWPAGALSRKKPPSTFFIAKSVGDEETYRFLYHATSRYVHFSSVEHARRGWSWTPGELVVGHEPYQKVWAGFALTWGPRLLFFTVAEVIEHLDSEQELPDLDEDAGDQIMMSLADAPLVPLLTLDELRWWTTPPNAS